jgi:putative DNA primase/helicase
MRNVLNKIIQNIPKGDGTNNSPENVCKVIQEKANELGYCFVCFEDTTVYCFTGKHWAPVPSQSLKVLLKACYIKHLGDDEVAGSKRSDIEGLVKQFPYTVMMPNVEQVRDRINFDNGTLDLKTMALSCHDWKDYFRYVLPYEYDPGSKCPMFMKYLDRVMPDESAQNVLAEYIGWLFTDMKLEKALFLYGSGCNGKSVFIDIMEAVVGKDNISHESISEMCGENGANHRSNIVGKLLNTCSDVSANAFSGDSFKRMASGEPISAKILFKDVYTTTDYAKMMFCLNELPKTKDTSNGYFRRLMIAPFKVQIPKDEIDTKLSYKIISSELPGIMNWVLEGRSRLVKNGNFSNCALFEKTLDEYRNANTKKKSGLILPPFNT